MSLPLLRSQISNCNSALRATFDQPSRVFGVDANSRGAPIVSLIFTGRGIFGLEGGPGKFRKDRKGQPAHLFPQRAFRGHF